MSSAKKNRPKKTMSLYEWQRQNQKHPNKPVDPTVSTSKKSTSAQSSAISKSNQTSATTKTWDRFHNPYHFVPAKKGGKIDDLSVTVFDDRQLDHITHDRYVDNTHSGRVICRLTAESPFFVGDEQTKEDSEDSPAKVSPFRVDGDKPAIPATSLRGLISNIAEAASNSALRVLEDKILSSRKKRDNSLSAIGMIIKRADSDEYRLLPLVMPTLQIDRSIDTRKTILLDYKYLIDNKYKKMFPEPRFKVYIDNYGSKKTFTAEQPVYYYMKLKNDWQYNSNYINYDVLLRLPHKKNKDGVRVENQSCVVGQKSISNNYDLSTIVRKGYIRGIVRILGVEGRSDIPRTKKHELFIPFPIETEKAMKGEALTEEQAKIWKTFPVPKSVIEKFNQLADERAKATKREKKHHPYEPIGTERTITLKGKENISTLRLKHSDIVYFMPDDTGNEIAEVSFSSIWRRSAGGTSHDYFRAISSELLPFNPDRKTITIAEQLFGFVEQDFSPDKSQLKDRQARGLASRLRFSHALFNGWGKGKDNGSNYYFNPVPLKILASPKPPSPALYFKNSNGRGGYISKEQLSPQRHHPQGRKFYLHQKKDGTPWKTRHLDDKCCKQKVEITPVRDGAVFYFHIDFDNLSAIELGLLLYSLNPSNTFHHKLGMGKPLGLGTVKIEPVGLFTINRKERYSVKPDEDIFAEGRKRYHYGWLKNKENYEILNDLYKQEAQDYDKGLKQIDCAKLRQDFAEKMDKDIQKALELLGNPDNVKLNVHYPQLKGKDIENENFRWFMNNDDRDNRNKQCLKPIELTPLS